jgi:hypothetical protein
MEIANTYLANTLERNFRLTIEVDIKTTYPKLRKDIIKRLEEVIDAVKNPASDLDYHDLITRDDLRVSGLMTGTANEGKIREMYEIASTQEGRLLGVAIAELANIGSEKDSMEIIKMLNAKANAVDEFQRMKREQYAVQEEVVAQDGMRPVPYPVPLA